MRYQSKDRLLEDAEAEYDRLCGLLRDLAPGDYEAAGVWGDGWNVKDLLSHLTAWLELFLGWYQSGLRGERPQLPAPGCRWNETPRLNRAIQARHRDCSLEDVRRDLDGAVASVHALLRELPSADLFEPGRFAWTGRNALVTYAGANTASHYRFANKVLRRWLRNR